MERVIIEEDTGKQQPKESVIDNEKILRLIH